MSDNETRDALVGWAGDAFTAGVETIARLERELGAARRVVTAVGSLAEEWAGQANGYGEDVDQQILDGKTILKALEQMGAVTWESLSTESLAAFATRALDRANREVAAARAESGRSVAMGDGDDADVKARHCCPTCRHDLADHNRAVWDAGYAMGQRHQRETAELDSRHCRANWVVASESEYAGCHHCALPHGHGGPHVEAEHGWRWTDTGPAPVAVRAS